MKKILPFLLIAIVAGGLAFYGGMQYGRMSGDAQTDVFQSSQSQQRVFSGSRGSRLGANGNFVIGDILSKDDKSVTVKLQNGGSKIVFYSSSTQISKVADTTASDLVQGVSVRVNGTTNSDGSVTAQSVQIVPAPKTMPSDGSVNAQSQQTVPATTTTS